MKKIGLVLGAAAMTTLVGCLDQNYVNSRKPVTRTPVAAPATDTVVTPDAPVVDVADTTVDAPISMPVVDVPPAVVLPPPPPPAPETTPYIVQPGDYLSAISKKYNIRLDAIRKANPQIKNDVIVVGKTIQLPGKVEVGPQKVIRPVAVKPASVKAAAAKPAPGPYTGATKEYIVKGGDSLSTIAHAHHLTTKQLKELNGLTSDSIRAGGKLKVPADGAAVAAAAVKPAVVEKPVEKPVEKTDEVVKPADPLDIESAAVEPPPAHSAAVEAVVPPAKPDYVTYTVQEGEDITSVSIQTYVSPSEIRQLNNLSDDAQLKPGMVLKLPASTVQ